MSILQDFKVAGSHENRIAKWMDWQITLYLSLIDKNIFSFQKSMQFNEELAKREYN